MIIRVVVENFLSIKERVELLMTPGKGQIHSNHIMTTGKRNDFKLLRSAVLFGANASGKSNIIKAISFAKKLALENPKNDVINYERFKLNEETYNNKPSRIEIEFKHNSGQCYAYGFIFDNTKIHEEWLYKISRKSENDVLVFNRKENDFEVNDKIFKQNNNGEKNLIFTLKTLVKDNQLFVSYINNQKKESFDNTFIDVLNVIAWFSNTLQIVFPNTRVKGIEINLMKNKEIKEMFIDYLNQFNLGINDICFEKKELSKAKDIPEKLKQALLDNQQKDNYGMIQINEKFLYIISYEKDKLMISKLVFIHKNNKNKDVVFNLEEESDGTNRIIELIPMINDLVNNEKVYLIDEIERSLHAKMVYSIFEMFFASKTNNQLIAATHETQLLTQLLLRKDEIWFVSKNEEGETKLYSLEKFKVRFDKEIRKDYLLGLFGATPKFNNRTFNSILN